MRKFLTLGMVGCALALGAVPGAVMAAAQGGEREGSAPEEKKITQQERMKRCNAEAKTKGLKGDERKAFMKDCLSTKR